MVSALKDSFENNADKFSTNYAVTRLIPLLLGYVDISVREVNYALLNRKEQQQVQIARAMMDRMGLQLASIDEETVFAPDITKLGEHFVNL